MTHSLSEFYDGTKISAYDMIGVASDPLRAITRTVFPENKAKAIPLMRRLLDFSERWNECHHNEVNKIKLEGRRTELVQLFKEMDDVAVQIILEQYDTFDAKEAVHHLARFYDPKLFERDMIMLAKHRGIKVEAIAQANGWCKCHGWTVDDYKTLLNHRERKQPKIPEGFVKAAEFGLPSGTPEAEIVAMIKGMTGAKYVKVMPGEPGGTGVIMASDVPFDDEDEEDMPTLRLATLEGKNLLN